MLGSEDWPRASLLGYFSELPKEFKKVCTDIPYFSKVRITPLCFHESPTLVLYLFLLTERNPKMICIFCDEKQK